MKVLFFGTPQLAVPYLEWLHAHHEVVGVVCRKDEPVGRGYKITPPPPKVFAQSNNIPVFQPDGPWTPETVAKLKSLGAKLGVAVAYGRLVPDDVIKASELGTLNIHFSLLPKYRGAGPMQWSLINGDKETGVTAFWIVKEMDAGPLFRQEKIAVQENDDALTLKEKLIDLGVKLLDSVMKDIEKGKIIREEQKGAVTMAPQLKKENGRIDWNKPASSIKNLIAGVAEWPGAATTFSVEGGPKKNLKIYKSKANGSSTKNQAGKIIELKKDVGFVVGTGSGSLLVTEVQPEGKKKMSAWDFWQGSRLKIGDRLG